MADFEARGADDFLRLSKALKHAGQTELRKELHKGMRTAAKPLVAEARAAALEELPQRGGLAPWVAKRSAFRAQVRTGEQTAGVRIASGKAGQAGRTLNALGWVRHKVFGNPEAWVTQHVPGAVGWFDRAMTKHAPEIADDIEKAMHDVAEQVVKEAKRG